jgi:hypothetical protein
MTDQLEKPVLDDQVVKSLAPTFDIGVRCFMDEKGSWQIQEVLPSIPEDSPDFISLVGIFIDIFGTAQKYMAVKHLVKPPSVKPPMDG